MKLTEISIKRTTIPVVIFVVLALAGLFCYSLLNKELTPSIEVPVNTIMTVYPGAAPSEVESSVTKKIEEAVSAIEGIDKITSNSFESFSLVTLQYVDGTDANLSLQECERRVKEIREKLPEKCRDPQFMKFDIGSFPIINMAVNANIPEKEFFDIVDNEVKVKLSQIEGVAKVDIIGGNEREIEVKADARKLEQYGISLLQIQQVMEAANIDFPTGKIKNDEAKYIVRLSGKFENLEQIENLIIGAAKDGSVIKLRDVATVVDGVKKNSKMARINGQNAIGLSIQKQTSGNGVEISKKVKAVIAEIEKNYAAQNLKFIIATDSAVFTESAISSVIEDLIIAILLVSITMLLFLHTFRNLIFILISIPTSIVSTFLFFYLFGFSLNLLTLLALSIVIGAIVDDAIVVLENIYRHLELGKTRIQASIDACKEIGLTVTSITLVLIAVFLPIGLTNGITGQMFRAFSLTIVISILISLLVSFTLVPLMTSRFGKLKVFNKKNIFDRFLHSFEDLINWVRKQVLSGMRGAIQYKKTTVAVVTILLFSSFYLIKGGFIQTEFMDAGDRGEFIISMELERTATIEQTQNMCKDVEKKMMNHAEITTVYTKVGSKASGLSAVEAPYSAMFQIKLVDKNVRSVSSKIFSKQLRNELTSSFAGPTFKVTEVSMVGTTSVPIQIFVRGNDFEKAKEYSKIVSNELRSIAGTMDVQSSVEVGDKEIVVKFDREKLAKLGLTIGEIGAQMYMYYEGNRDMKYTDHNTEYDIYLSLDEFDRHSKTDVENISFMNRAGQLVRLSQVATISESESPSTLTRYNKLPAVNITGNLVGKTIGTIGAEIKAKLAKNKPPMGVDIVYAGDMEQQSKSASSMGIALLASLIFMYLIMVALYDSYVYPLVVMLSLPLAMIGAFLALALAGKSLSLFSIMGIIMLMGLVAKNAILVVDFANKLQQDGKKTLSAITQATSVRFRPILMTNLALIVGLLPIALASGAGAEWKNSLGWVLIGGLTSSTILAFIVVPVLYVILDRFASKSPSQRAQKELVAPEVLVSEVN